jgi:hypothetical protein
MDIEIFPSNDLPTDQLPTIITAAPLKTRFEPILPVSKTLELWAFLENSDFVRHKNSSLYRQDEVRLIRHDEFLEVDYKLMVEAGCLGVRDAARWYISHPAPGVFDWTWLDKVVSAAEKYNLKLYLDLWHSNLTPA